MSDDPLDRLERLNQEATPGEWRVYERTRIEIEPEKDGYSSAGITHRSGSGFYMGADAELAAESRNALPILLEVARAAREQPMQTYALTRALGRLDNPQGGTHE